MIPRISSLTLLPALVLVGLFMPGSSSAAPRENAGDKVFVGYVFGQPRNINFRLYTHLFHAFLTADGDGKLRQGRNVPDSRLVADAHKAGVKVVISVGGWGWDEQFAAIVSDPQAEDRYARAVMEFVSKNDYDGIDLDWEYPDTEKEVVGFERLTRRFRKELDALGTSRGKPMVLTMAASANPGTLKWLKKDFLVENMDWINVMTYDYSGQWTSYAGHHSPLFASSRQPQGHRVSTELTMKYLLEDRGLPANRLAIGIPLYGRGFPVAEPYASTKGVARTRLPESGYNRLHELETKAGWTRRWDDETKNPWLVSSKPPMVIGYDDAESVTIKCEWAVRQGLRGVFFWQVAADRLPDGTNPLQEAAHRVLLEKSH